MNIFLDVLSGILLITGGIIMIVSFVWWITSEVYNVFRLNSIDTLHINDTRFLMAEVERLEEKISYLIDEIKDIKDGYKSELTLLINQIEDLEKKISDTRENNNAY